MFKLALAFIVGLLAGFLCPHSSTPPEPIKAPEVSCPICPPAPKCEANKNLVSAAEMIQSELHRCVEDFGRSADQLEYCEGRETNLATELDEWRTRYYQNH